MYIIYQKYPQNDTGRPNDSNPNTWPIFVDYDVVGILTILTQGIQKKNTMQHTVL